MGASSKRRLWRRNRSAPNNPMVVKRNVSGVPKTHNHGRLNAARLSIDWSNSVGCGEGTGVGVEIRVGNVAAGSVRISSAGNAGNMGILSATGSLRGRGGRLLPTTTAIGRGARPHGLRIDLL